MTPGAARRSPPRTVFSAAVRTLAACALAGASASPALASDARREAVELVRARRCELALPVLERAREADPGDARLFLLSAECQIRLRRYADALASLAEVKRLEPRLPDADLYRAIAEYHTGDLDAAEHSLEAARETSPGRADADLYLGLVLLQRGRPGEAAEALRRARTRDAASVEPVASYYEGLALEAGGDREAAREALQRVQDLAPDSEWAQAAARALAREPGWGPHRAFVEISSGAEWNTNVTLAGSDITPGGISGRRDVDSMWSAIGGAEIYRGETFTVGALASYYGNAHTKLYEFDLEYPGASIWIDRPVSDDTTLRLQGDFSYAWYGYRPYEVYGGITPQIYRSWGDYGLTWGYAEFYGGDIFFDSVDYPDVGQPGGFGPRGVDEAAARNRDGWGLTAGVLHTFPIPETGIELRGGANYLHYWSVGPEWRYDGWEAVLGFRTPLLWQFELDGQAGFTYRAFYHPSTYPQNNSLPLVYAGAKRRDNVWEFEVKLERPLTSWLTASARYYYLDNGSNTNVFNYRQQIWGGYLTLSFRQP